MYMYFVGKKVKSVYGHEGVIASCTKAEGKDAHDHGTELVVVWDDMSLGNYWVDTDATCGIYRHGQEHKMVEEFFHIPPRYDF